MKLSVSSIRKTDYLHTLFIIYSSSLCLCCTHFQLISWMRAFALLSKPIRSTTVSQLSHCCQSLKSVPFPAAVSCHFTVRLMQPSSTSTVFPVGPSNEPFWGPAPHLIHPDLQSLLFTPSPPPPPVPRLQGEIFLYTSRHHYPLTIWTYTHGAIWEEFGLQ